MKRILAFLVIATASVCYAQQYGSSSNYSQYSGTQGQQQQQQGQSATGQMPSNGSGVMNDCSHLSQQEQAFAQKLSTQHRTMFCRHFSVAQRIEAMTLATSPVQSLQGQTTNLTPDEAVEIVMKNSRDNQTQQQGSSTQTPGSGSYSYPSSGNSNRNSSSYSNYGS